MFSLKLKMMDLLDLKCTDSDAPKWVQKRLCDEGESFADALCRLADLSDLVMWHKIKRNMVSGEMFIRESELIRLIEFIGICGYLNDADVTRWKANLKRVCDDRRTKMVGEILAEYETAVRDTIPDEVFERIGRSRESYDG